MFTYMLQGPRLCWDGKSPTDARMIGFQIEYGLALWWPLAGGMDTLFRAISGCDLTRFHPWQPCW